MGEAGHGVEGERRSHRGRPSQGGRQAASASRVVISGRPLPVQGEYATQGGLPWAHAANTDNEVLKVSIIKTSQRPCFHRRKTHKQQESKDTHKKRRRPEPRRRALGEGRLGAGLTLTAPHGRMGGERQRTHVHTCFPEQLSAHHQPGAGQTHPSVPVELRVSISPTLKRVSQYRAL